MLVVFEDAHWIDPSSRELLDLAVERAAGLPILLLVTFRPEFEPPWIGQPHVTALALSRLGPRDAAALARRVAGGERWQTIWWPRSSSARTGCRCSSRS